MASRFWFCVAPAALLCAAHATGWAASDTPDPSLGSVHLPMRPYFNPDGTFVRFRGTITTQSWSGYAVTSGAPYQSASATWQVPNVSYDGGSTPYGYEYVLNWTGIGGYGDSTLIQLGTEEMISTTGVKSFYTWYELYPAVSQNAGLTVKAGDIITASLQCTANCSPSQTQTWQLTITDNTTGAAWGQTVPYHSSMASAEWVIEPPYYNGFLPLADYSITTYDPVEANGQNPNLSLSANGIIMEGGYGQTSNPSAPSSGDAFSLCWGKTTLTPCTYTPIVAPPPVVTAALTASPSTITVGQSATLTWKSTNANSCTGSGFTGSGISGSAVVTPAVTTSYSITCSDGSDPATALATVTVTSSTSTALNPPNPFGLESSGHSPESGDLLVDVLIPNTEAGTSPSGLSYTITGGTISPATTTFKGEWTTGQLDAFLGISAEPTNPIGAFLGPCTAAMPCTKDLVPSATGFLVNSEAGGGEV